MSSDEELEDGFITHPRSWQRETFAKLKSKLDTVYLATCSNKSRRATDAEQDCMILSC